MRSADLGSKELIMWSRAPGSSLPGKRTRIPAFFGISTLELLSQAKRLRRRGGTDSNQGNQGEGSVLGFFAHRMPSCSFTPIEGELNCLPMEFRTGGGEGADRDLGFQLKAFGCGATGLSLTGSRAPFLQGGHTGREGLGCTTLGAGCGALGREGGGGDGWFG